VTKPLTIFNSTIGRTESQGWLGCSRIVAELEGIFAGIPYQSLIDAILAPRIRAFSPLGRFGYPLEALLRAVIASYYLHLKSTAQLVRRLQDDPILAVTCGFDPRDIPHRTTFSRFIGKLTKYQAILDTFIASVTSEVKALIPEFGQIISVDSTPVRSYSNPDKKRVSDPEAAWIVKSGVGKHKEWHFGFKLHMAVDSNLELPIAKKFTLAQASDTQTMLPLLEEAKQQMSWFSPDVIIADKGYDSGYNYRGVVDEFGASPVIPLSARSKGTMPELTGSSSKPCCPAGLTLVYRSKDKRKGRQYQCPDRAGKADCPMTEKCGLKMVWLNPEQDYRRFGYMVKRGTDEWTKIYHKRSASERVFSRLKQTRRLEEHCFRGFDRLNTHTTLSILTMQALALAKAKAGRVDDIRGCVRQVG
jgi:hypothetical protein